MAKPFRRIEIEANDDGTFLLEFWPYVEPKKDGNVIELGGEVKRVTCPNLKQLPEKIEALTKGALNNPGKKGGKKSLKSYMEDVKK